MSKKKKHLMERQKSRRRHRREHNACRNRAIISNRKVKRVIIKGTREVPNEKGTEPADTKSRSRRRASTSRDERRGPKILGEERSKRSLEIEVRDDN